MQRPERELPHQARVSVLDDDRAGRLRGGPVVVRHLRAQVGVRLVGGQLREEAVGAPRDVRGDVVRAETSDLRSVSLLLHRVCNR